MTRSVLGNDVRKPDVTFYGNGKINLTAGVARLLDIREGDSVDIAQDDAGDCFLYVRHRADASSPYRYQAVCRPTSGGRNMRAYSQKLCRFIIRMCREEVVQLNIGEPAELAGIGPALPLITAKYTSRI